MDRKKKKKKSFDVAWNGLPLKKKKKKMKASGLPKTVGERRERGEGEGGWTNGTSDV